MPTGDPNRPFRMGAWLVRPDLNRLFDGDRVITLQPRVMGMLVCLAGQPGKTLSADKLLDTVWHGRAHTDNTIYQSATHLRKALGDDINNPRYIETIPKKGYRLICPVTLLAEDSEMGEIALHSPKGRLLRRRNLAIFAGIASIAVAIILTVKPEVWGRLLPTADGPSDRSVAVLPFVDMSEDGSQQFLGDGIAEELIHVLSNLPDLRVIARTSSFAFKDRNEDIRQIGKMLNVATILEGSVRKNGDRIRITAQLVDAGDGYHLWSQSFDRHASDIFRIQNEIAVAVADIFEYREQDALAIENHAARPDELKTHDLYLLGLHQLHKNTPSAYMLAIQHFETAIKMDPGFARAYAGMAESYLSRYWYEGDQELLDKAESAAEYALLLDDQSAEAYVAVGRMKSKKGDLAGAEAAFTKVVELNPNDARAYGFLLSTYERLGRSDEAHVMLQKALDLQPMSGELNNLMGRYYNSSIAQLDWDMAFKYFKRAWERDPNHYLAYKAVGLHYWSIGQLDQAIPYLRKRVELTTGPTKAGKRIGSLASTYVDMGDYKSAAQVIRRTRELEPDHFGATNSEIHLQLARGDFSAARDIVHTILPANIDKDGIMGLMAFYEMVLGDLNHAEEIYARLAAAQEPDIYGQVNLYRGNELIWGMMGAVNLAYLRKRNGQNRAAEELLRKARDFIEPYSDHPFYVSSIPYVLSQIAAVEGNNNSAIEYFRRAIDAGWTKAWFGRIDPIMADLRKDARYMQILGELEQKLFEMREQPKMLVLNEPWNYEIQRGSLPPL